MNIQEANLQDILAFYFEESGASSAAKELLKAINNSDNEWLKRMLRHHREKSVIDQHEINFRKALDDLIVCYNVLEVCITGGLIPPPDVEYEFWMVTRVILENEYVSQYYVIHYPERLPQLLLFRLQSKFGNLQTEREALGTLFSFLDIDRKFVRNHRGKYLLRMLDDCKIAGFRFKDVSNLLETPDKLIESLLKKHEDRDILDKTIQELDLFLEFCFNLNETLLRAQPMPLLQSEIWLRYAYWFEIVGEKLNRNLDRALEKFLSWNQCHDDHVYSEVKDYVSHARVILKNLISAKYSEFVDRTLKEIGDADSTKDLVKENLEIGTSEQQKTKQTHIKDLKLKRKLILYQQPSFGDEIYNELSTYDWDVYLAKDFQQASDLVDKHKFIVGLCLIEKCVNTQQLTQLHRLFNVHSQINWIMGLPKEYMKKMAPDFIDIKPLAEYCHLYITLPVDIKRLLIALNDAYGMNEICPDSKETIDDYPSTFGIIGNSLPMQNLFNLLKKVAKEDCSVLIEGETGTGKELVANAIHKHSSRSKNPFVAINCGAFPKDLIQAELFGYEKGAFTGAQQRKIGCIESAQNGTLFLDEIGDLPLEQQVNLLRFLEDNTIVRIGGTEKIKVNVRVIAATHVDLKEAVKNGNFREDLYYRLRALQVRTPPLRTRDNDIEMLAWYFFNKFSENKTYQAKGFNADALYLLKNYDWPGNVRELMNSIRHALVISENRLLSPYDLGLDRRYKCRMLNTLEEARAHADRESIITSPRKPTTM